MLVDTGVPSHKETFYDLNEQEEKLDDDSEISLFRHGIPEVGTRNQVSTTGNEVSSLIPEQSASLNKSTIKKVAGYTTASALFATSAVTGCLWGYNTKVLDLSMFANGISVTAICILALSSNPALRKFLSETSANWCYEFLFFATQIFLNLIPKQDRGIAGSVFSWIYGAMESKDILNHVNLTQADLPLSCMPPKKKDLLLTLGYTTRNTQWRNGTMATLFSVGCILTILNFALFKNKYYDFDDYGKLGVYQDLIAMLTSFSASNLVTGYFCDRIRALEKEFFSSIIEGKPQSRILKMGNFAKRISLLAAPVVVGVTLAIDAVPNSAQDYFSISLATFLCAQAVFLSAEEFENPNSRLHEIKKISDAKNPELLTMQDSIKRWMKKYGASLLFEVAFVAFFTWVLVDDPKDWSIVLGVLFTSLASFILTDVLAAYYRPQRDNRMLNTLAFHTLYFPLWMAFLYEYITTKLEIDNQSLDRNSTELFLMGHGGWVTLGANIGINRAANIQDKSYSLLATNPAFFTQEMSKFFIDRLTT